MVSDYNVSAQSARKLISGNRGEGSSIIGGIALYRNDDIEEKKRIAKMLEKIPI